MSWPVRLCPICGEEITNPQLPMILYGTEYWLTNREGDVDRMICAECTPKIVIKTNAKPWFGVEATPTP